MSNSGVNYESLLPENLVKTVGNQNIEGKKTFKEEVVVPAATSGTNPARKEYVDAAIFGLTGHASSRYATAAALPANAYLAGVITGSAFGELEVDSKKVAIGNRILVKNEVAEANNGIYVVTKVGAVAEFFVLTRASDMNEVSEIPGAFTFIEEGNVNKNRGYFVASAGPFTIGTTPIVWSQFTGAGDLTAGEGIKITGNEVAVSSSVANGSAVTTGNGLIWTGSAWANANLITAPAAMTAQDLIIGSSATAMGRVAVGSAGQMLVVRSDGTLGYIKTIIHVVAWGAKCDGVTDDTAAVKAAIEAAQPANIVVDGVAATVKWPAGTCISGPLPPLSQQIGLQGVGPATILQLKAESPQYANLVQNYQGAEETSSQRISVTEMTLDGNAANQKVAGNYQTGIYVKNPTPKGSYTYQDGRHEVRNVLIQNFTGDGMCQAGRGVMMASNVSAWICNGFGFNINTDSYYDHCDAGACGLDGFLIQGGSNQFSGCKGWFSGAALVLSRKTNAGPQPTVTAPARAECGGNIAGGLTFSLANGYGNGWHWTNISGTAIIGNNSGGTYSSVCAQDNARAGFYLDGAGRQTLTGVEADSNNNNGTSDGTSTGTPVGGYAGVELNKAVNCRVIGTSWDRAANTNHQAAALRILSGASRNAVELGFFGSLNDASNMPPLTSDSVVTNTNGGNAVKFAAQSGYFEHASGVAEVTPDPYQSSTYAMTLTQSLTINAPKLNGTNTTGLFLVPGMELTFVFTQDATGGRGVNFNAVFVLPSNWSIEAAAEANCAIRFIWNGTKWIGCGPTSGELQPAAFIQRATTSASGTALINGTQTLLTYTTPNDGKLHNCLISGAIVVASGGGAESASTITLETFTGGIGRIVTIDAGSHSAGTVSPMSNSSAVVDPNTAVVIKQTVANTGGTTKFYGSIVTN